MAIATIENAPAARTVELSSDLAQAYFDYAVETIQDRALADVRDGLKPVQRRILYAMHDLGLRYNQPHKKSARVVGEVLGKYHPHGDLSVYYAMVRMAQDFSMRHELVDGQGNYGSIDGDSPAAMRYTEARLTKLAETMMADIDRDTVPWEDNFDGSLQEPSVLPTVFPNMLVNGTAGIAVGMASNIAPHNLGEVCDAVVYLCGVWQQREGVTVDDLMEIIPGPDFPTGGLIYRYRSDRSDDERVDVIRQAYAEGRGRIVMQAKIDIQDISGGKSAIIVTEIPYAVQKSTILERIGKVVRDGRITGVTDVRDESDFSGMRVVVEVSRNASPNEVLGDLLTYTQLRETFGVQARALVPDEETGERFPRMLSLKEMLTYFVDHRLDVIVRRTRHELDERERRLHIVQGLLKALDAIDEVIDIIRRSRTPDTASRNLQRGIKVTEVQAEAILAMPLRRLVALERRKLQDEEKELEARIKYLRKLLESEEERLMVVVEETTALKDEYATPRRTVILDEDADATQVVTQAELVVPEEPQMVLLTTKGVQRTDAKGFRDQSKDGVTSRAVETTRARIEAAPEEDIILFSRSGRAWRANVGHLPSDSTSAVEMGLSDKGDAIVGVGVARAGHFAVVATLAGQVKRMAIEDIDGAEGFWSRVIGLDDEAENDGVICAGIVPEGADVFLFTRNAQALRFSTDDVNPQSTPSAKGVKAINVKEDDVLLSGEVFMPDDVTHVIVVSEAGYIKRVPLEEFLVKGRGGLGVRLLNTTKTTGDLAAATVAPAEGTVDVIVDQGRRHRFAVADVPEGTRAQYGEEMLTEFEEDERIIGVFALN